MFITFLSDCKFKHHGNEKMEVPKDWLMEVEVELV